MKLAMPVPSLYSLVIPKREGYGMPSLREIHVKARWPDALKVSALAENFSSSRPTNSVFPITAHPINAASIAGRKDDAIAA
ncbi:MAG: hypothetical protein HZC43_09485 [Nitrosomonadales bacterium]|nr:hypothetical protein [Nitrosomonadales bacterium]